MRQPALHCSDIQVVEGVNRETYSHLYNTVVFSSRGTVPLFKKLAGGDLDGDTFLIIWERFLVQRFKGMNQYKKPLNLPKL